MISIYVWVIAALLETTSFHDIDSEDLWHVCVWLTLYCGFLTFSPKRLGIFDPFLHTYYTFISTLDYKIFIRLSPILTNYAILSETTYRIFYISLELNL